jgi:hypothetical protein
MIEHLGWLKSFGSFWKAIFDRLSFWINRRKPKLYVQFEPGVSVWCIAQSGPPPNGIEYMQVVCQANVTHDDPQIALIITDVYPAGTSTQVRAMREFKIPPHAMVKQKLVSIAGPLIAKKGSPWTGKIVLVDQFLRKYRTKKVTFKWVGDGSTP